MTEFITNWIKEIISCLPKRRGQQKGNILWIRTFFFKLQSWREKRRHLERNSWGDNQQTYERKLLLHFKSGYGECNHFGTQEITDRWATGAVSIGYYFLFIIQRIEVNPSPHWRAFVNQMKTGFQVLLPGISSHLENQCTCMDGRRNNSHKNGPGRIL